MNNKKSIFTIIMMVCLPLIILANTDTTSRSGKISLNIRFLESKPGDTLTVKLDDVFHILNGDPGKTYTATRGADGYYRFNIPVTLDHGYFTLSKARILKAGINGDLIRMCKPLFWEKSDSIDFKISFKDSPTGQNGICEFTGTGAEKYNASYKISTLQIHQSIWNHQDSLYRSWNGNILAYPEFDSATQYTLMRLDVLNTYVHKISNFSYQVIKADILYADPNVLGKIKTWAMNNGGKNLDQNQRNKIIKHFGNSFDYPNNYAIDPLALAYSLNYLIHLNRKLQAACFLNQEKYDLEWMYKTLKGYQVNTEVRDIMIMMLLTRITFNSENPAPVYNDALGLIKNPAYVKIISALLKGVPGVKFGEFVLHDADGRNRSISEFKGKVLLIDIWYTGCGACADFYQNVLSAVEEELKENPKVKFISISIDRDKESWSKSVQGGKYTSLDAVNLYTDGKMDKHPIITSNSILSYPSLILLDQEGKIRFFNSENLRTKSTLLKAIYALL